MKPASAQRVHALFLSCTLLAAIPLFARSATDVIVMKNGDRITCEVKGLDKGVLSVSLDYVDGTVSVDWAKVARLESSQFFVLLTQGGNSYEGTLATTETPPGQPLTIKVTETTGKTQELERNQVVSMKGSSVPFWQRFNGVVDFGVEYSKGNNATQYTFGAATDYARERWGAEARYDSTLSSNTGSTTSTRNQVSLRGYHLLRRDNYFYQGQAGFLQSSVQGITLQSTLGGAVGHFFKNTNNTSIAVSGGLSWQGTDYQASGRQNIAAGVLGVDMKLFKFKKTRLNVSASFLPALSDPGRVFFDTNASYYLKIFGDLSWNLTFYGNWDNLPPAGLSGSDYGSSAGLSWNFGNR